MFVVRKHRLHEGLNHISLPLGAEAHTIDRMPDGLYLWYSGPEIAPALENRIFLVAEEGVPAEDAPAGQIRRYIASGVYRLSEHVFEFVPRVVNTPTGDQLLGEGR
jgi:hypothetical protein